MDLEYFILGDEFPVKFHLMLEDSLHQLEGVDSEKNEDRIQIISCLAFWTQLRATLPTAQEKSKFMAFSP